MSLSAILTEAYNFFRNHLVQLAMLTVPLLLIQVGIQLWLGAEMSKADLENPQFGAPHMLAMMLLLLTFSVLIAALTLFLELRSQGASSFCWYGVESQLTFCAAVITRRGILWSSDFGASDVICCFWPNVVDRTRDQFLSLCPFSLCELYGGGRTLNATGSHKRKLQF